MSKPFDMQEAIVLLDVYLHTVEKGSTLMEAAKIASKRLRALAKANTENCARKDTPMPPERMGAPQTP